MDNTCCESHHSKISVKMQQSNLQQLIRLSRLQAQSFQSNLNHALVLSIKVKVELVRLFLMSFQLQHEQQHIFDSAKTLAVAQAVLSAQRVEIRQYQVRSISRQTALAAGTPFCVGSERKRISGQSLLYTSYCNYQTKSQRKSPILTQ